ncbi:MAG: biopolymer transporter ExbD [Chthoniobacterales bacterium]|nr:biopolymer transporter ExbD [Chthoniobacterales bacterium]
MRFYHKKRRIPSITIVSLIDILAILLIFFIVTTTFRKNLPQLQINLPESKTATPSAASAKKNIILQIKSAEVITLDTKPVTAALLPEALRAIQKENPNCNITMQADKEAPFGTVVTVLDALQIAGIKNIPTMMKPATPAP